MFGPLGKLVKDRRGATAIEYGLILALVVLAIMGAVHALAGQTTAMWNNVANRVTTAS